MTNGAPEELDLSAIASGTSTSAVSVRQLTPTQRAGMQLAIGVGLLIAVVTVIAVVGYVIFAPAMPTQLPENPDTAKAVIENRKMMSEVYMTQALKVFETVVLGGLLPIFTAILGYIFGTQTAAPPTGE
jgi:hypothetical protein